MRAPTDGPPPFPPDWTLQDAPPPHWAAESERLHAAHAVSTKPVKETTEDRAKRMKAEKDDRAIQRFKEEQDRVAATIDAKLDTVAPDLPSANLARSFCRLMLPDMLAVVAEVALNRLEPGAARVNAAEKLITRAAGEAREYVTKLGKDIATMNHAETAEYLIRQEQEGLLSMAETKHLLDLSAARQEDRVSQLEAQVADLVRLVGGVSRDVDGTLHRAN